MLKLFDRKSKAAPAPLTTRLARIRSLEPRMVFDAAAAATADAASKNQSDQGQGGAEAAAPNWMPAAYTADASHAANEQPHGDTQSNTGADHGADATVHAAEPAAAKGTEIVVVDSSVPDMQEILKGLPKDAEVILIDRTKDGVDQLAKALEGRTDISAIHIISHGKSGEFYLGTSKVDAASIAGKYADEFAAIGKSFTADADLLIYGCDFGAGTKGATAVEALGRATGLDIAASDDATGHESRGGDWDLEIHFGEITTAVVIDQATRDGWEHVLARANITITGNPTVRDGNGNAITGTTANGVTTYAVDANVVGATSVWQNAGTIDGEQIALRATVVSIGETNDLVSFRTTGDDATVLIRDDNNANSNGAAQIEIRWEILRASDLSVLTADVDFRIADIDGINGAPNTRETVSTSKADLSSYTLGTPTDIRVDAGGTRVSFSGTEDENNPQGATISSQSIVGMSFVNKTSFNITYTLTANTVTGQAAFQHDGDFDLVIDNPVTTFVPRLDLDGNDSTGATGTGYRGEYVATGAGVSVVDTDVTITNSGNGISSATVVLTNAQAGDVLAVGTLPAGITGTVDTSVAGRITVTLSGAGTAADYQAALQAVTFANANAVPSGVSRLIDVRVADGVASSDAARSTITVDRNPVAANDTFRSNEDVAATINVLTNDSDPDSDTLTITQINGMAIAAGGPGVTVTGGTVSLTSAGALVFRPTANYNGTTSFTYTVTDGRGGTATATVTGIVDPVGDSINNVVPGNQTATEDTPVVFSTANGNAIQISDPDSDTVTVTLTVTKGLLTLSQTTGLTFTTGDGTSDATMTLSGSVAAINAALQGMRFDPTPDSNGQATFTIMSVTPPGSDAAISNGGFEQPASSAGIKYVSDTQFPGWRTSEADGLIEVWHSGDQGITSRQGNQFIELNANAASTVSQSVKPEAGSPLNLSFSHRGRNGTDVMNVRVVDLGADGLVGGGDDTVLLNENFRDGTAWADYVRNLGTATGNTVLMQFTAVSSAGNDPTAGNFLDAVSLGSVRASDTDSFNINVTPVQDTTDDAITTAEDTPATFNVITGTNGATADSFENPDRVVTSVTQGQNGTVTFQPDGTITYTPNRDFNGTDSFTYTVTSGGVTETATVVMTVTAVNDAPVAGVDSFTTNEDVSVDISVLANDADADGDALTVTEVEGQAITVGGPAITVAGGTVTLGANGVLTFTPNPDFNGSVSFDYTVSDGNGGEAVGTVTGSVAAVNDAPVNTLPPTFTTAEDTAVQLTGLAVSDVDANGAAITVTLGVGSGALSATSANGVTVTGSGTGTLTLSGTVTALNAYLASASAPTFTPAANANGDVVLTMTTNDGGATGSGGPQSDVDTARITVTAVDDAPVAGGDSFTTNEDAPVTIDVLANDADVDGDALTVTEINGQPITAGGPAVAVTGGSVTLGVNGRLTFTPAADFNGPVSFDYTVSDGNGGEAVGTVTGSVAAVNDAPVNTLPPTFATQEDTPLPLTGISVADVDSGAQPITVTLSVGAGILTAANGAGVSATGSGSNTITLTGSVSDINAYLASASAPTFTPAANASGSVTLTMTANDNGNTGAGGALADVDTATITVTAVNDAPVAGADSFTTNEDAPVTIDVRANDADVDGDTLTVTEINGQPITAGGPAVAVTGGSVTLGANGQLTFTPAADFNGPVSFDYTVSDGNGGEAVATVTGSVAAVNDAPVNTLPAVIAATEDTTVRLDGLSVSDVDAGTSPITVTLAVGSGTLTAIPGGGVTVTGSGTGSLTLTGTVGALNAYLGSASAPAYTPAADVNGDVTLTMTSNDGGATPGPARSDVDTAIIRIASVNDAPTAGPDSFATNEDTPVTIPVLANDSDVDGGVLTVTAINGLPITAGGPAVTVAGGSVTLGAGGVLTFTPAPDFNGSVSFSYSVSDGQGGVTVGTVTGDVAAVNDAPVNTLPTGLTTAEDTPLQLTGLSVTDVDANGSPITVTLAVGSGALAGSSSGGVTVTGSGTGSLTLTGTVAAINAYLAGQNAPVFTPDPDANGPVTLTMTSNDGGATGPNGPQTDVDTTTISVTPVNDAPVNTLPAIFPVTEDTPTSLSGISISDVDAGSTPVTVTLQVGSGRLTAVAGSGVTVAGSGTGTLTLTGTVADINAYLAASAPSFTPAANATADVTLTMTTNDRGGTGAGGARTDVDTATIRITPVNDAPVAVNDRVSTNEDVPVNFDVRANDRDADGDPLTVTHINGVAITAGGPAVAVTRGTVSLGADGTLTFTPAANATQSATFTYSVSDGNGGTSTATVRIDFTAQNDAPVNALPGTFTTAEDTSLPLTGLSISDVDAGTSPVTVTLGVSSGALSATAAGNVGVSGSGTGSLTLTGTVANINAYLRGQNAPTFAPDADFNGAVTLTMTTNDGGATGAGGPMTDVDTATITVTPVQDAPVAVGDSVTTREDVAIVIDVLANDRDADGDPLVVTQINGRPITAGGPAVAVTGGTVSLRTDGRLTFTPSPDYDGQASFNYTISDGNGGEATAGVTVTITGENDAPVAGAIPDRSSVDGQTVRLPVAPFFSDADGDALTYSATGLPPGLTIDAQTGVISGVMDRSASQGAPYSVTVMASDGNGGSATTSFAWEVSNPAPDAVPDAATVAEDGVVTIPVLANDADPDGDPLTVVMASAVNGAVTINANGTLTYRPNANFNGRDTITYRISDGQGGFATATVTVDVTPVQDAPTATTPPDQDGVDGRPASADVSGYFSDADGDPLTYSATGLPPGLSIDSATGKITGVISQTASSGGPYTVVVTADDGNGGTVSASFTWRVAAVAPEANPDTAQTSEDTAVTVDVLANDVSDGGQLTIVSASAGNGTVTIQGGSITYTPDANFNGTDTVTYTVRDQNGGTASTTLTVTVNAVNDAPTAQPVAPRTGLDGEQVSLPVSSFFSDADGDALTYSATGLPPGLTINAATGVISGTIDRSASRGAPYTVTVTATDGSQASVSTSFAWNVTNPVPVAAHDTATVSEDAGPITINVLANDRDSDGDPLTVIAASAANGTVVINGDGTVSYRPNPNFTGSDTISYRISDGDGGEATATVSVTVTPRNDPPVVQPSSATVAEDTPTTIPGLANASDPDGDPLTVTGASAANGAVTVNPDGTLTYTPANDFNGTDTITYTVSDGKGGVTTGTVTVTVTPVNDAPVVQPSTATVVEDTPTTIPALANATDADGDPLTVTGASATNGTVTVNPDGTLTYTPAANFNGTDTITYTVSDGNGGVTTGTVTVSVTPVNDAPVVQPSTATVVEDTPTTIPGLANATDPDGDPLTVTGASATNGTVVVNPNGTLTYTPAPNFNGSDTITYTVSDGNGGVTTGTVTVTVTPVNDAPVVQPSTATVVEDTPTTIPALANATDADGDPLTVTGASAANGTVTVNPDGTITYTPAANFNGTDTITYTVSDGNGGVTTGTVTVMVTPVNDAPVVQPSTATVVEDTPTTIPALANATDADGDPLTVTGASAANGTVVINPNGTITYTPAPNFNGTDTITYTVSDGNGGVTAGTVTVTVTPVNDAPVVQPSTATVVEDTPTTIPALANATDADGDPLTVTGASAANGTVVVNPNGTLTYTPAANFNGTDTITYTVSDGNGGVTTGTVTVTVTPVNDAPVVQPSTATVVEDTPTRIPGLANATDPDGDPLTVTGASAANGTVTVNANGTLTYTPAPNFNGTDTITYTVSDGNGGVTTGTVTVTVTPVNDAPVVQPSTATVVEDTPTTIPALANATDADGDPLTVTGASAANGTVVVNPDGTITYTPAANFNGTDTITYTVSDGNGGVTTGTVTVTVTPVNDAPVAGAIGQQSGSDAQTVSFDVSGAFSDADGDPLGFTATGLPPGLSIDPQTGLITGVIARDASQARTYIVTVTASDGNGGTASTTFAWVISNPDPVASPDAASTRPGQSVQIDVLANDSDPDGDPLTVTGAQAERGTVTIGANGVLTYVPPAGFVGTDTITYSVSDGNGGVAVTTVTVSVINRNPVVDAPPLVVVADQPATGEISTVDPDGDPVTIVIGQPPQHGTVTLSPDGGYVYTPNPGYLGDDSFTVVVTDPFGGSTTVTVGVSVVENLTVPQVPPSPEPPYAPPPPSPGPSSADSGKVDGVVVDTVRSIEPLNSLAQIDLTEGAVIAAVNGVHTLGGVGAWNGTIAGEVARQEAWSPLSQPLAADHERGGFDARPYLGRSLEIVQDGDRAHSVMMEAFRSGESLVINMRGIWVGQGGSRLVDTDLIYPDGRPAPAWLQRGDGDAFWGRPPSGVKTLDLVARFLFEDGTLVEKRVLIDAESGEIREKPEERSEAAPAAPMFTAQLASSNAASDLAALERALGL